MRRKSPLMARRLVSSFSPQTSSRSSSLDSFSRHTIDMAKSNPPSEPTRRGHRLWLIVLILTFILFERASVFAAPAVPSLTPPQPMRRDSDDSPVDDATSTVEEPVRATANNPTEEIDTREANIAYFIQIAENTIDHLPRLLSKLYHERNVYAIHFDLKIPQKAIRAAEADIRSNPLYASNVHVMPSELITYRGVSMLLNTINAMRLLIDKDNNWDYFINLSGADYPLITANLQRKLLGQELGLNYFTFAPKRTWDDMAENRLSEVWYDEGITFRRSASLGKLSKLDVRNPLVDDREFDVSHAEAWMISSREFCDFVVRGDMARKMLVAFAYAVDSSEHYFASLAWNHEKYKKSIVPHSLRMIIWMHDGVLSGQHPYYVDEENDGGDYKFKDEVSESVLFFARKFQKTDSKLMDYIDERSSQKDVVEKVTKHLDKKVASRERRLAEL